MTTIRRREYDGAPCLLTFCTCSGDQMVVVIDEGVAERGAIRIEVGEGVTDDHAELYDGVETRGPGEKILQVSRPLFQEAVALVRSCAEEVVRQLGAMAEAEQPTETELQMAVRMDGRVGAKIVELSSGAQLQVTLRWKREST